MRGMDWKKSQVETITNLVRTKPVVGVASIHEIPASQFQSIRRDLREDVIIRISKRTLIRQAFAKSEKGNLPELETSMDGEIALLFTDMNPFRLFRYLEERKVRSPAKPGHRPPEDVWVSKGQTPFAPGPIVSQLQKVGIPARIERGKVVILKDTLFVKAGEEIDRAKSDILASLDIHPMKIGLDVGAIYEDGMIFERSVLDIDQDVIAGQISLAAKQAFNLAFNSGFFTESTIVPMLQDAYMKARALSIGAGIPTPETVGDMLSLAQQGMLGLAATLARKNPEAVGEDLIDKIGTVQDEGGKEEEKASEEATTEAPEEKEEEESPGLGALFG